MAIPTLDQDLNIIQKLDDYPNDVDGMSADELKAKFDEAATEIAKYINETLIPAIKAANIPFAKVSGIESETVQGAVEETYAAVQGAVVGKIPNASITMAKLASDVTAKLEGLASADTELAAAIQNLSDSVSASFASVDASLDGKQPKQKALSFTLNSSGWQKNEEVGGYYQTVQVEGLDPSTPVVVVDVDLPINTTSRDVILNAWIIGPGKNKASQGYGNLTFYSDSIPEVNIPINVGI